MRVIKLLLLLPPLALLLSHHAGAQGITCAQARHPLDVQICATPSLLVLDRNLATAYAAALARDPAQAEALRQAQRDWLADRDRGCTQPQAAAACLRSAYLARIAALSATTTPPVPAARPAPPPAASTAAPAAVPAGPAPAAPAPPPAAAPVAAPPPAPPANAAIPASPQASLSLDRFPTAGQHDVLLRIAQSGRYSIRAASETGTALQLVDMLAGPGEVAGAAGAQDGRIDALLEAGIYKLRAFGDAAARGETRLLVAEFQEAAPPVVAVPGALVSGELADLQQRSVWITLDAPRSLRIEAAGRSLRDLRLWREGSDLLAAQPAVSVIEPTAGHPLRRLLLETRLEAGSYRIQLHGGEALAWTDGDARQPLHLRLDASQALAEGWVTGRIGPFGSERFEVPGQAGHFLLDLPQPADVSLAVDTAGRPLLRGALARNSRELALQLRPGPRGTAARLVELRGSEGQEYRLRSITVAGSRTLDRPGQHWLTAETIGFGGDEAPATVLLARQAPGQPLQPLAAQAPRLGTGQAWRLRFNLRGGTSLIFEVVQPGPVALRSSGVAVTAAVQPLRGYGTAAAAPQPGDRWDLPAGWYALGLQPAAGAGPGVLELVLGDPGAVPRDLAPQPPHPVLPLGRHGIEQDQQLLLFGNTLPNGQIGLAARSLPADLLAQPLVVTQPAGEALDLQVIAPTFGSLAVTEIGGGSIPFSFVAASRPASLRVAPAAVARTLVLAWRQPPAAVALPAPRPLPALPPLAAGRPLPIDLRQGESRSVTLTVPEGGLYRVESTGRLRTSGEIGTAFLPALSSAEANGIGGNMLLQRPLRAGRYRVTVTALEGSGRLGLLAQPAAINTTGTLLPGGTQRATMTAGTALVLPIRIATAGRHRIELLGLDRSFTARLEDAEGWPLTETAATTQLDQDLAAGDYRLVVMPEPVAARVLARLTALPAATAREGHGPFSLPFEATQRHEWREPAARDAPRQPDRWDFALAGEAAVTLTLTAGMQARLLPQDGGAALAQLAAGSPFNGTLPAGRYRVEAQGASRDDRLPYGITLRSEELQPGVPRPVSLPASLSFSIAEARVVSLTSFGDQDLRAVLRDAEGREVARDDDRADDWNIALSRLLPAGRYRLDLAAAVPRLQGERRVEESDTDEAEEDDPPRNASAPDDADEDAPAGDNRLAVTLALPEALPPRPASLQGSQELAAPGLHRLHLPTLANGLLLVAAGSAAEEMVLALEQRQPDGNWRNAAVERGRQPVLAMPMPAGPAETWRLAAWRVDGGAAPMRIALRLVDTPAQAAPTVRLAPLSLDALGTLHIAQVALAAPQALVLRGTAWRQGSRPGQALVAADAGLLLPQSRTLWLLGREAADVSLAPAEAGAQSLVLPLAAGEQAELPPRPLPADRLAAWLAQSGFGQPGLEAGAGMGIATGSALAVATEAPLRAWNAGDDGALAMQLRLLDLQRQPAAAAGPMMLPAASATPVSLPDAPQRLRLDLSPHTAAVLRGGAAPVTIWAGDAPLRRMLEGQWREVLLLNAATTAAPAAVAAAPLGAPPLVLRPGQPLKRFLGAGGSIALAVEARPGQRLVVVGGASATLVSNGRVRRGTALPLDGPAALVLEHGPGALAAWVEGEGASPWPELAAEAVSLPLHQPLAQPARRLAFTLDTPMLLRARTTAPVIIALAQDGQREAPQLFPAGAEYHRYLAAGSAELWLMAAQDGAMTGSLELTAVAVQQLGEGLGEPVLAGPGDTALFGFTLARAGRIGLGLRAEPDHVAVRLLDARGQPLGEGVALLRQLPAGRYVMEARLPTEAPPSLLRPAVVGIDPRPNGPPPDVVQGYLSLVGISPSRSGTPR